MMSHISIDRPWKYHDWTEQQFIKNGYQLQQWKEIIKNNNIILLLFSNFYIIFLINIKVG